MSDTDTPIIHKVEDSTEKILVGQRYLESLKQLGRASTKLARIGSLYSFRATKKLIGQTGYYLRNRSVRKTSGPAIPTAPATQRSIDQLVKTLHQFEPRSKKFWLTLGGLTLLLVTVFATVGYFKYRHASNELSRARIQSENAIQDLLVQAEARKIFDQASAKQNLTQAMTQFSDYLTRFGRTAAATQLENYAQQIGAELRHEKTVTPTLMFKLTETATHLVVTGNALFALQKSGIISKNSKPLITSNQPKATALSGGDKGVYWLSEIGKLYTSDSAGQFQEITDHLLAPDIDINFYGGRLYWLDTKVGKILKADINGTKLGATQNWLKSKNSDLTQAKTIVVDGDIFAMFPKVVQRFHKGVRQNWSLAATDPAPQNFNLITTSADFNELYVFDAGSQRLIVFSKKDGALLRQLVLKGLPNLTDMVVSTDNKIIYLLANDAIYQSPLN